MAELAQWAGEYDRAGGPPPKPALPPLTPEEKLECDKEVNIGRPRVLQKLMAQGKCTSGN